MNATFIEKARTPVLRLCFRQKECRSQSASISPNARNVSFLCHTSGTSIRPSKWRATTKEYKLMLIAETKRSSMILANYISNGTGVREQILHSAVSWKGPVGGIIVCLLSLIIYQQLQDNVKPHDRNGTTESSTGSFRELLQRALSGITGGPSINISPLEFSKFSLDYIQPITSTTSIFSLSRPPFTQVDAKYFDMWWKVGVWSIEIKQPDMQISRHYTPLPPCVPLGEDDDAMIKDGNLQLRFLVKKEEGGEVSGWLFRQNGSNQIEMRGPHMEYELPHDVSEILFLAGGTGVAPALQVAHALQRRQLPESSSGAASRKVNMRLVWANRYVPDTSKPNDKLEFRPRPCGPDTQGGFVLMKRVQSLQSPHDHVKLEVDMYCDSDGQFIRKDALRQYISTANKRHYESGSVGRKVILVSGPDGFAEYISGRKPTKPWVWTPNSRTCLGGLLSDTNLDGWEVVKL